MFRIRSLRAKTVLWVLIPTVLVMVAAGIIALYAYERAARDLVQERDAELARISAARLSEGLSHYSRVLASVASEDDVQSGEPARVGSALEEAQNQLYVFDAGVMVYNDEGVALWSQPFVAERQGTDYPIPSQLDKVRKTRQPTFSNVFDDEISDENVVLLGVPILDSSGEFRGVLAGMFEMKYPLLGAIYAEVLQLKVGQSGYAYLVDGNGQVIYHPDGALMGTNLADTELVAQATGGGSGAAVTKDSTGETVISGFAPVPGTGWGLVTQERWGDVVGPIRGYSQLLLGLLVVGGLVSGAVIFFAIGRILKPIKDLTRGAQRIAGGDFDYTIAAKTGDELDDLAQRFSGMASALRESYSSLEQKVEERTRGERRRADQLRTINEVGRTISSILSLDELLPYVVNSMQESFRHYNVNIFLLDTTSGDLILKAGAGGYKGPAPIGTSLKATEGIVGWVAQQGEPLLVNDVSKEPKYRFVDELADTRSELAVPIKMGARTLGVLDIESADVDAFDEIDLFTAHTLGDQVAVAIENAQLYQQARELATVEERQRLARDLHDAVTQTLFSASLIADVLPRLWEKNPADGQQRLAELRQLTRGALAEMRMLLLELRPTVLTDVELGDLLRQLTDAITGWARVPIDFTVEGQRALLPDVQVAFYRIAQEALNNVAKHAGASEATVGLRCQSDRVELVIRDNGCGFNPESTPPEHLGLTIMRERAEAIRATLTIESQVGRGTEILVVWTDTAAKE